MRDISLSNEQKDEVARLAKGLTLSEFEDAIAKSLLEKETPIADIILDQKKIIVKI